MPYISKQELAFSNNAFQHSYTSLSAVTTKYSRDSAINNCQSWGGGQNCVAVLPHLPITRAFRILKLKCKTQLAQETD